MSRIDLDMIMPVGVASFLNTNTKVITRSGGKTFGASRKCLNIFLRDCSHNFWIRERFNFSSFEADLELPLDSKTMHGIREHAVGDKALKKVKVKEIDQILNDEYQLVAAKIAAHLGTNRVRLDALWWLA